jgi:hypothetical protein
MLRGVKLEQVADTLEILATGRTQQAVGADLGEAAREDVLEKARDEDIDRQCHALALVSARVRVSEGDVVVFEAFEAVVGKGHAVDVAREVERGLLAAADLLDMDDPRPLPCGGIEITIQAGASHGIPHLGAEEFGEYKAGEEEA